MTFVIKRLWYIF